MAGCTSTFKMLVPDRGRTLLSTMHDLEDYLNIRVPISYFLGFSTFVASEFSSCC